MDLNEEKKYLNKLEVDPKRQKKYLNKCLRVLKGKKSYKIKTFIDLAKAIKISIKTFRFYNLNNVPEIKEILQSNRHEKSVKNAKQKKEPNLPKKNVKPEENLPQKNVEEKRIRSYEEIKAKLFGYKAFKTKNYNHTDYPITNKERKCLGLLQLTDLNKIYRKKVYLVDHNEISQTIDGIEDAELVGVIDHHKINPMQSLNPISFINKPYGSTNSIIYELFVENEIEIPKSIAGMMLSGILSDTLIFKSPTTTPKDIKYAQMLANIANVDIEKYGMDMIISGSELNNKSIDEILFGDFKDFTVEENRIGVSQIITMNIDKILNDKDEYIKLMNNLVEKNNYELMLFCATDLIKEGSYIFFNDKAKEILELSLGISNINQGIFLPGVVSRKKQIIPKIIRYIEKR